MVAVLPSLSYGNGLPVTGSRGMGTRVTAWRDAGISPPFAAAWSRTASTARSRAYASGDAPSSVYRADLLEREEFTNLRNYGIACLNRTRGNFMGPPSTRRGAGPLRALFRRDVARFSWREPHYRARIV
jgi:hypothetical protein